jgi:sphingomyelin phosphodiesterase
MAQTNGSYDRNTGMLAVGIPREDPISPAETLRVLTYNIFMRPPQIVNEVCILFCDDQHIRAPLIGSHPDLRGYDVIVFEEAFSDPHRREVLAGLASDYPYQTRILGRDRFLPLPWNGGVIILSKWPIEREFQRLYGDLCTGEDCGAQKGVLYARLNVNGKPLHLLGTHTQAGDGNDRRLTRESQLINIKFLIDSMAIPPDQPVLIAGDLNVDLYVAQEYSTLLSILSATHPEPQSGNRGYTSHPDNDYVPDSHDPKYLDYFLFSNSHLVPAQAFNDVRIFQVDGMDLSDHYALEGQFTFTGMGTSPMGTFPFAAFFSGNNAQGEFICTRSMEREKTLRFPDYECAGDEIRSLIVYDVPADSILRLYDDAEGDRNDDWVEILFKRAVAEKQIGTLEQSFEDDELRVTYYPNNGLDGKVSRVEIGCQGGNNPQFAPLAAAGDGCAGPTGQARIETPNSGQQFQVGTTVNVEVRGTLTANWAKLDLTKVSDGTTATISDFVRENDLFKFQWVVPTEPPSESYDLKASVEGLLDSEVVRVYAISGDPLAWTVDFISPLPGGWAEPNSFLAATVQVTGPQAGEDADYVLLYVDGSLKGTMNKKGAGFHELMWRSGGDGTVHILRAVAHRYNQSVASREITVTVRVTQDFFVRIGAPSPGYAGTQVTITVTAPESISRRLEINDVAVSLTPDSKDHAKWFFSFRPSVGMYRLEAEAQFPGGVTKTDARTMEVKEALNWRITPINQYAVLGEVSIPTQGAPLEFRSFVNTPFDTATYACGVAGFAARGGDIGETINHDEFMNVWPDLLGLYLEDGGGGNYQLMADFNTLHLGWLIWPFELDIVYQDRPETWDVTLLCVSKQVASRYKFPDLKDNVRRNTQLSFTEQVCGIAGIYAEDGDINESGTGDIIQTYLYREGGYWQIRADFRTHQSDKPHGKENWRVDLLCLNREVASLEGPAPGKTFFLQEFRPSTDQWNYFTGIPTKDYTCGVMGFAARHGDIDEHDKGANDSLFMAFMTPGSDGVWRFTGDFRSHHTHEWWDNVNVLCALKEGGSTPTWNVSHTEWEWGIISTPVGPAFVPFYFQVLPDEHINFPSNATVMVIGGGIAGGTLEMFPACGASLENIAVYRNDRDPSTWKNRWDPANLWKCVRNGDSVTLESRGNGMINGYVYDFRGAMTADGTPLPIELHGAEPDLTVQALGWPTSAKAGSLVNLVYMNRNIGTAHTPTGYLAQLYVDGNKVVNQGGQVGSRQHVALAPGGSDTNGFQWRATCGTHSVEVRTDDAGQITELRENNNVTAPSHKITIPCSAPVFEPLEDKVMAPYELLEVEVVASDPDGDRLEIALTDAPAGAWVNEVTPGVGNSPPASLKFYWSPDETQTGLHTATFTATDEHGQSATTTLVIVVCQGNPCGFVAPVSTKLPAFPGGATASKRFTTKTQSPLGEANRKRRIGLKVS